MIVGAAVGGLRVLGGYGLDRARGGGGDIFGRRLTAR
jgi:hypothetical protein